jgi:pimeloyl-ACP methyl ester carboxylesterase
MTIAYDVRGRGSPLVLIQGLGVGRWGWEPVAARLARRFQVVSIDNRGIGASDTPPGRHPARGRLLALIGALVLRMPTGATPTWTRQQTGSNRCL